MYRKKQCFSSHTTCHHAAATQAEIFARVSPQTVDRLKSVINCETVNDGNTCPCLTKYEHDNNNNAQLTMCVCDNNRLIFLFCHSSLILFRRTHLSAAVSFCLLLLLRPTCPVNTFFSHLENHSLVMSS